MAGHSKWASIKHKKAIVDSRRGQAFTKLARAIAVAAREGGGDISANASLGLAVQKAKDASMPKDNIERAIARGTGEGADLDAIQAVMYEGYGPGGVALLVEALSDNRNRTGANMRHAFMKAGSSLGEPGSVAYLFDKKGVATIDGEKYSEDDLLGAIEAGAEDVVVEDEIIEVICEPQSLSEVRAALEADEIEIQNVGLQFRPKVRTAIDEDQARALMKLIDVLESDDDVNEVHANFDIDDDVLERVMG
ncbi:MAG: YebC/PmpR family DNA-binding transcriptional regulator [Solirubrobacteraceae bacterium]|nr:YebC/PmpR family DNA-binding transcriptional regulator [Solirubrobacteraceae bacterium]